MRNILYIMAFGLTALSIFGCSENEVVTSYEEVKATTEPIPVTFSTYVGEMTDGSASTRADLQYLAFFHPESGNRMYKNIPFLGESRNNESNIPRDGTQIGHAAYNNYIVGVYGFWHEGSDWNTDKDDPALKADFMTNQPLLHLWDPDTAGRAPYWYYSPTKYWPNSNVKETASGYVGSRDKVTFISYYPFQDYVSMGRDASASTPGYYRDGQGTSVTDRIHWIGQDGKDGSGNNLPYNGLSDRNFTTINNISYKTFSDSRTKQNKDLTNIVPPAKDAVGDLACTFEFQQKPNVEDHIDFMMGLNEHEPDYTLNQEVTLNLKHTLCAIFFLCDFSDPTKDVYGNYYQEVPSKVKWKVNSIKLKGLKDHAKVVPYFDENNLIKFDWKEWYPIDEEHPLVPHTQDYTIFQDESDTRIFPNCTYNVEKNDSYVEGTTITKNNLKYKTPTPASGGARNFNVYTNPDSKGWGYKWIILALPQTTTDQCEVEVDYNLTYEYADKGLTVLYQNCKDVKQISGLNLEAGKALYFKLFFYLKDIKMDAEVKEWPTDEELEVEGEIDG